MRVDAYREDLAVGGPRAPHGAVLEAGDDDVAVHREGADAWASLGKARPPHVAAVGVDAGSQSFAVASSKTRQVLVYSLATRSLVAALALPGARGVCVAGGFVVGAGTGRVAFWDATASYAVYEDAPISVTAKALCAPRGGADIVAIAEGGALLTYDAAALRAAAAAAPPPPPPLSGHAGPVQAVCAVRDGAANGCRRVSHLPSRGSLSGDRYLSSRGSLESSPRLSRGVI